MSISPQWLINFQTLIPKHRGVFTINDLENLFLTRHPVAIQQKLKPFLQAKILNRFCRGFYVAESFDLEWLSQRICPESAISFGSVLAKEMVIGSNPQKAVYAAKVGMSRVYKSSLGAVVHLAFSSLKAAKSLWFGYERFENGIRYANQEKAFLDTLYFYQLGHKFSFNIYSDIQISRLNKKKIAHYLEHYRNPKFVKFVEGILSGKH